MGSLFLTIKSWMRRRCLPALVCAGLFVSGLIPVVRAGTEPVAIRLIRSDEAGVSFEALISHYDMAPSNRIEGAQLLKIPGFWSVTRPGEPNIPSRAYLVAIPPQVAYSVRFTALNTVSLGSHRIEPMPFPEIEGDRAEGLFMGERFRMDEGVYTGYRPEPAAEGGQAQYLRRQRVVPVRVTPVSYDPITGEVSLVTRLRVDVSFSRPPESPARDRTDSGRPATESAAWERIINRSVINAEQSRIWRRPRTEPGLKDSWSGAAPGAAVSGPVIKLKIRETGLHKLTAADAVAGGFPAGEPVANLHLFKRNYSRAALSESLVDIAFTLREGDGSTNGIFDGQDVIIFHAQRLRDDADRDDPVEKFADYNCVWLGATGGPTMIIQPLRRGYVSADTATVSFESSRIYEQDNFFVEETPPSFSGFYPSQVQIDVYSYNDPKASALTIPFWVQAMKPGTSLQVNAELMGAAFFVSNREATLNISNSQGNTPLPNTLVPNFNRVAYSSGPVAASAIDEGVNNLVFGHGPPTRGTLEYFVFRAEVTYQSLYRADDNTLAFNTGTLSGDTSLTVTGLTDLDLVLFDVTDPLAPRQYLVADSLFTNVGGTYAFSFRENLSSRREYILTTVDNITSVQPADISAGAGSSLIGHSLESGVDALVVCYRGYLDEMADWVAFRRAQGYKVLMADVNSIYDEFNSGVPNPRAIKNFIRHFYERGNASFVTLVGDASEDNRSIHSDSPPNFVPTESYPEYVGGSFNVNEMVTSDKWYVLMENDYLPGQYDYMPDLIIGRIPAGSDLELQIILHKIFIFEQPGASDFWRRRMILMADDAWSDRGNGSTCYNSSEPGFQLAQDEAAQIIEATNSGVDVVKFYLSEYTDDVLPTPPTCISSLVPREHVLMNALPDFMAELDEGATLVSLQSHINRSLVAHEGLFTTQFYFGSYRQDHRKVNNYDRPFIIFGFGCHFSDYALYREMSPNNQAKNDATGDCFAELLMIQNNKGAVSTYGSSGFEYLNANRDFSGVIFDNFFTYPPQDTMAGTGRAQVRWILGELMTASEIDYAISGPIRRFHLLGDPLLRIDAGPPRFLVEVNGQPAQSGDVVYGAAGSDTILVTGTIIDELAIEKVSLEIDGADETGSLTVTALMDDTLSAARHYGFSFSHKLTPRTYDIILRASQAPDTTGGQYYMNAEFVLHVESDVSLTVNGREVGDGDIVPPKGDYLLELGFPVVVQQSAIEVRIDDLPVAGLQFSHPTPEDSTTWLIGFQAELASGPHTLQALVDGVVMLEMQLVVSSELGLSRVINYPNPFSLDTHFMFSNDVPISSGYIDIYTVSGKKIHRLDIPPESRLPGQNAVYWNGRDSAGDEVANGVYLYIITVDQQGQQSTFTGKMARIE